MICENSQENPKNTVIYPMPKLWESLVRALAKAVE
jgi:hypothetical protein